MGSGSGGEIFFRFDGRYNAGYRFNPTDYVLVEEYLRKKNNGDPLPPNIIGEVDLYASNPQVLVSKYHHLHGTELHARDKKYKNGKRPSRHTNDKVGYWKATGADQRIVDGNNRDTGYVKKTLVYYLHDHKTQPKKVGDKKTDWIMHEYCLKAWSDNKSDEGLLEKSKSKKHSLDPSVEPKVKDENSMRLEGWALCRIYEKRRKGEGKNTGEDVDENSDNETTDDEQQEINGGIMASIQQQYDQEEDALKIGANPSRGYQVIAAREGFGQVTCKEEFNAADPAGPTILPTTHCHQNMVAETRPDKDFSADELASIPYRTDQWYTTQDEELYSLMYAEIEPPNTNSLFDHQPLERNIEPLARSYNNQNENVPLPQLVSDEFLNQAFPTQEMNQVPNKARDKSTNENGYFSRFY
ncbi:hypothetical protein ACLOJK_033910 [Asimina triloba]